MSLCQDKYNKLMQEINRVMNILLSEKNIEKHPIDRPWVTSKLKKWIRNRQNAFIRYGKSSPLYKFWRNKIQREIKTMHEELFYSSRVYDLEYSNPISGGNKSNPCRVKIGNKNGITNTWEGLGI